MLTRFFQDHAEISLRHFGSRIKNSLHRGVPPFIIFMKSVNTTGQVIFISRQAASYFKLTNLSLLRAFSASTAIGSITIILICKSRAIYRTFGFRQIEDNVLVREEPDAVPWPASGKVAYAVLTGCSLISGLFDGMYGYFGANVVSEIVIKALFPKAAFADSLVTLFSICGFGISAACYLAYDFFAVLNVNTKRIACSFHVNQLPINRALIKTLLVGLPIAGFMAAQTIFTTQPALGSVTDKLSEPMLKLLSELAGLITFSTVTAFLPTIYDYFTPSTAMSSQYGQEGNRESQHQIVANETNNLKLCRYTTYITGTCDSLLNTGLGIFLAIVFSLNQLFGFNPYGWIIIIAFLGGVYAAILNAATTIRPGYLERKAALQQARQEEENNQDRGSELTEIRTEVEESNTANPISLFFKKASRNLKSKLGLETNSVVEQEMIEFSLV